MVVALFCAKGGYQFAVATAISTATTTWSISRCTEAEVPLTALTYTSAVAEQDARQGTCANV